LGKEGAVFTTCCEAQRRLVLEKKVRVSGQTIGERIGGVRRKEMGEHSAKGREESGSAEKKTTPGGM